MTRHAALLRAVNVGKRKVPMAELREVAEGLGLARVRTYIQSGNLLFDAEPGPDLALRLAAAIEARFGFAVPVVLRTAAELRVTIDRVPFADLEHVHVAFLDRAPSAAEVASLEPDRSPGDAWEVVGADLYLHLPNGVGRSKITNEWLDRRLRATSTSRNWRTVLALGELTAGHPEAPAGTG